MRRQIRSELFANAVEVNAFRLSFWDLPGETHSNDTKKKDSFISGDFRVFQCLPRRSLTRKGGSSVVRTLIIKFVRNIF